MSFTVTPYISSLNPTSGPAGINITVTGTSFGASQGSNSVTVGGLIASVISWSDTSIVCQVPNGLVAGTHDVIVIVNSISSNIQLFNVLLPNISGVSPSSGPVGTTITITGTNFGTSQGASTVTIGGELAGIISWGDNQIVANVPLSLSVGQKSLIVTTPAGSSSSVFFTVSPFISNISPESGSGGALVTISGTGFGSTQGSSTVSFNGTDAGIATSWSNISITISVPNAASTGPVIVTVNGIASNAVGFTTIPAITGLSPTSGTVGTSVLVSGTNFGPSQGSSTVTFNGLLASVSSWGNTALSVLVPSVASAGINTVVVTVNGIQSNGISFTVTPYISSLNPTSGPAGTNITITGTSFGATQGLSTVKVGGNTASITNWSNNSIIASIPSGLLPNTYDVIVTVQGLPSNSRSFLLSPWIYDINPGYGITGETITITGMSFGDVQGASTLTFNGVPASVSTWSNSSIVALVPSTTTGPVIVTVNSITSNSVSFIVGFPCGCESGNDYVTIFNVQPQPGYLFPNGSLIFTVTACYTLTSETGVLELAVQDEFSFLNTITQTVSGPRGIKTMTLSATSISGLTAVLSLGLLNEDMTEFLAADADTYRIQRACAGGCIENYLRITNSVPSNGSIIETGSNNFTITAYHRADAPKVLFLGFYDENLDLVGQCCTTTVSGFGTETLYANGINVPCGTDIFYIVALMINFPPAPPDSRWDMVSFPICVSCP